MRGVILLVVIWALALLAILAAVFISNAQSEKQVTRNFTDEALAKALAQSGVEFGLSKLNTTLSRNFFGPDGNMERYWTEELVEQAPEGLMKIRIQDFQGKINVNDGVGYLKDHSLNKNLQRILDILGKQIGVDKLGEKILNGRPLDGYKQEYDMARALGVDDLEKTRRHITVHSWRNNKVANPVPISQFEVGNSMYPVRYVRPLDSNGNAIYRRGHNRDRSGNLITAQLKFYRDGDGPETYPSAVLSYDTLNPQWIELVPRSPININTATKEVLTALITDLQGFYIQERKVPAPTFINVGPLTEWVAGRGMTFSLHQNGFYYKYDLTPEQHFYMKGNPNAFVSDDHLGIIQTTTPFNDANGTSPSAIADEIISCRSKSVSKSGINYNVEPVGGSIKTWAQFNIFVNNLVQKRVILDNRDRFHDLWMDPTLEAMIIRWASSRPPQPIRMEVEKRDSTIQRLIASQAAADVLKANFNPNLNLNELNPNRNLFTLVDKTDLIVNSTEFCFLPMGYFQIDSTGEFQTDGKTVATKRAMTSLKIYDVLHESTQKDFYAGTFGNNNSAISTNNGYAIETGPEPDNGIAPQECDYSGYISLSTYLGVGSKTKGTLVTTHHKQGVYANALLSPYPRSNDPCCFGADMHVHYQLDHVAHYHKFEKTLPIGPFKDQFIAYGRLGGDPLRNRPEGRGDMYNYKDRDEQTESPYSPVNGERYRICRSFEYKAGMLFNPASYEPSDLRVDGAYFETHSAVAYHVPYKYPREYTNPWNVFIDPFQLPNPGVYDYNDMPMQMFISFYVKPNFYPESSERIRQFVASNLYGNPDSSGGMSDGIFLHGLYWFPAYQSQTPLPISILSFPPRTSFVYNIRVGQWIKEWRQGGVLQYPCESIWYTNCGFSHLVFANPLTSDYDTPRTDGSQRYYGSNGQYMKFRKNEWIHVMLEAKKEQDDTTRLNIGNIYINQERFNNSTALVNYLLGASHSKIMRLFNGPYITIGGECSSAYWGHPFYKGIDRSDAIPRYYFADSTIDEVFVWFNKNNDAYQRSETMYSVLGRYYKQVDWDNEMLFTSRRINFQKQVKILGISWTVFAEDYDLSLGKIRPAFYNYQNNPPDAMYTPNLKDVNDFEANGTCIVYLDVNGQMAGPFGNDGYSPVHLNANQLICQELVYKLSFRVGSEAAFLGTTLLATPIFDDITIFYSQGSPQFLSYIIV